MGKNTLPVILSALLLSMTVAGSAPGDERILSFHSDVTVNEDGWLDVIETITVRAEGQQIKRGICRDFPTLYRGRFLSRHALPFQVIAVTQDGRPEPYHTKGIRNGIRVYVGREDVHLKPGEYTYTLTYRTDRQLGFFGNNDELYWNVTGNDWAFIIEKASARVILPESVPRDRVRLEGYTGPQGAKGKHFTAETDADGRPVFSTTRLLNAREGLTIVVSWPKGHVQPPTNARKVSWVLHNNRGVGVGLLGCVLLVVYYLWAWQRVGRDPAKGTIIPLFEPPDGLSPAAVRYIREMGYDDRCLAAAAIDMAVKGRVKIQTKDGDYAMSKLEGEVDDLAPEQRAIAKTVTQRKLWFRQTYHSRIRAMIKRVKEALDGQFAKGYFKLNRWYLVPGLILSFVAFGAAALLTPTPAGDAPPFLFVVIWLSIWSLGVIALLRTVWQQWRAVAAGGGKLGNAVGMTLFAVPFVAGEVFGLWMLIMSMNALILVVFACALTIDLIFAHLLKAYSRKGRKLMDRVEGFRMYLGTAERYSLAMAGAPDRTPELFEKHLPYALALEVENRWAEQFSDVLSAAGEEYSPSWYVGVGWHPHAVAGFASSMGSTLSSAVAASSTAPGSVSGGGGGGSSGGGGGGGGGGGW